MYAHSHYAIQLHTGLQSPLVNSPASTGGKADHLPALKVLTVECGQVDAAMSSHSLVEVDLGASKAAPFPVRPQITHLVARATKSDVELELTAHFALCVQVRALPCQNT